MKIEDKLLDLYGISKAEAKHYWFATSYIGVLKDKVCKAERLKKKLVDSPMMTRDNLRIARLTKAINFNEELLLEVV